MFWAHNLLPLSNAMKEVEWHPKGYWASRDNGTWVLSASPGWCNRTRRLQWMVNTWSSVGSKWLEDEHNSRSSEPKHHQCCFCSRVSDIRTACRACTERVVKATQELEGTSDLSPAVNCRELPPAVDIEGEIDADEVPFG